MASSDATTEAQQRLATNRPEDRDRIGVISSQVGRFGIPGLLVILLVFFSLLLPNSFATKGNYQSLFANESIVALLALATMLPLIVGEFDLSVAAVLTLSQAVAVSLMVEDRWSPVLAVVLSLMCCGLAGLINGVVVVKLRVNAFVATLASSTVLGGIVLWFTGGNTLFNGVPVSFTNLGRNNVVSIPLPVVYLLAVAATLWFALSWLPVGRRMYATGGNRTAAALSGINTDRFVIGAFVASGLLSGLAGVILAAQLGAASPSAGTDLLLPAFAGAFLGATTIVPGRFNVIGTVVSVYTLSVAITGLQQEGAAPWVQPVFNGTTLIIAVGLSGYAIRLKAVRAKKRQLAGLAAKAEQEPAENGGPPPPLTPPALKR